MELCRPARSRDAGQEAGADRMAGVSQHAAQPRIRGRALGRARRQGRAAAVHLQEWSSFGRGGESHDRGRLQYMSQRSRRLRGAPGCAGQARHGRGLEGSGTSVETNIMNRIQAPVTGNKNNQASYGQKTMAGADMEEVAGRKELDGHWVRR